MTAGRIVLWRHGQTDYNAGYRLQGQIDIPLNDVGLEQARTAAGPLSEWKPTHIVSSPLSRAASTARELSRMTGVHVGLDDRLVERGFGRWEGLTHEEIEEQWPQEYLRWRLGHDPEGVGVESRADASNRIADAIRELAEPLDSEDVLVLVAHGAIITLGITRLLQLDPTAWFGFFSLHNCHWSVVAPSLRIPDWGVIQHNVGVGVPGA